MSADAFEPKRAPVEPLVMPWVADHTRSMLIAGTILSVLLVGATIAMVAAFLALGGR